MSTYLLNFLPVQKLPDMQGMECFTVYHVQRLWEGALPCEELLFEEVGHQTRVTTFEYILATKSVYWSMFFFSLYLMMENA